MRPSDDEDNGDPVIDETTEQVAEVVVERGGKKYKIHQRARTINTYPGPVDAPGAVFGPPPDDQEG